jgi:hypothetical protein
MFDSNLVQNDFFYQTEGVYVYFYENDFQNRSINMIFIILNSTT